MYVYIYKDILALALDDVRRGFGETESTHIYIYTYIHIHIRTHTPVDVYIPMQGTEMIRAGASEACPLGINLCSQQGCPQRYIQLLPSGREFRSCRLALSSPRACLLPPLLYASKAETALQKGSTSYAFRTKDACSRAAQLLLLHCRHQDIQSITVPVLCGQLTLTRVMVGGRRIECRPWPI